MPPRKSNISQATATEEGGTPTKEREGGINIEVPYRFSYSLLPPCPPLEGLYSFPDPLPLGFPVVPMASSSPIPQASSPASVPSAYAPILGSRDSPIVVEDAPIIGSRDSPIVVEDDEEDEDDIYDSLVMPFRYTENDFIGQDLSLPRTMVQRLAKGVLPPNTSLHKDAVLALSKGATVFINYLAQAAHESNQSSKSYRTIPPGAVLEALHDLEFENFVPRVDAELRKFNEVQTGKRNEYRRKVKEEKTGKKGDGDGEAGADTTLSGAEGDGEERAAKRVRRSEGGEEVTTMSPEVGDGSEQLREQLGQHNGEEEEEDEEFDAPDEVEEAEEGPEGESSMYNLRQGKEEEEDEEEEDEEEDEDEDEYPDEGRRLSSVEREAFALEHQGDPGSASGSGSSGGEEESD